MCLFLKLPMIRETFIPDHAKVVPTSVVVWSPAAGGVPEASIDALRVAYKSVRQASVESELAMSTANAFALVVVLVDSLEPLLRVRCVHPGTQWLIPVICVVPDDNVALAVGAAQAGVFDVLGVSACTVAGWQKVLARVPDRQLSTYVFVDNVSRHLLELTERVAQTQVTVLLAGPTGAGKEVLARIIHERSSRRNGPFVALNCAALPEALAEDMLFGHDKGAFTGAHKAHPGVFEQANGGSLLLDEIGELPLSMQAKLLRTLQERSVTRLGGRSPIRFDVRLIAATNRDLVEAVALKMFREDLYFRVSTFKLCLPALRARPGDILPLAQHLLNVYGSASGQYQLTDAARSALLGHSWAGNIRELENVIQRALIMAGSTVIDRHHLIFDYPDADQTGVLQVKHLVPQVDSGLSVAGLGNKALCNAVRLSEHEAIMAALHASENRLDAARQLGISPRTLRYKLAKFREQGLQCSG